MVFIKRLYPVCTAIMRSRNVRYRRKKNYWLQLYSNLWIKCLEDDWGRISNNYWQRNQAATIMMMIDFEFGTLQETVQMYVEKRASIEKRLCWVWFFLWNPQMTKLSTIPQHQLSITCGLCKHHSMLEVANLIAVVGGDTTAHEVRQRYSCPKCKAKGNNTYQIIRERWGHRALACSLTIRFYLAACFAS